MTTYKRILHPTDFSESSEPAFAAAITAARRSGAELHLVHIAPPFGEDPLHSAYVAAQDERQFYKKVREDVDVRLPALIKKYNATDLQIKQSHSHGASPAVLILAYADAEHIDLIVIGTHGRRGLRRFLVGSVAEEVIRGASCDVLAVRQRPEPLAINKLLVPVDLTATSETQLQFAIRFAALYGAEIDLVYVLPEPPLPSWGVDADVLYGLLPERKREAQKELDRMVASMPHNGVIIRTAVAEGFAGRAIHEAAQAKGSDVILIAPHSRGRIERLFLGSVTEWIIRHSDRSIYVAHASVGVPAPAGSMS